jgi:hypothetical protein
VGGLARFRVLFVPFGKSKEKSVKIICVKSSFSLKKPLLFKKKDLSLRHAPAGSR